VSSAVASSAGAVTGRSSRAVGLTVRCHIERKPTRVRVDRAVGTRVVLGTASSGEPGLT